MSVKWWGKINKIGWLWRGWLGSWGKVLIRFWIALRSGLFSLALIDLNVLKFIAAWAFILDYLWSNYEVNSVSNWKRRVTWQTESVYVIHLNTLSFHKNLVDIWSKFRFKIRIKLDAHFVAYYWDEHDWVLERSCEDFLNDVFWT